MLEDIIFLIFAVYGHGKENNFCVAQYCEMLVCLLLTCFEVLEDVKPFNYPVKF